MAWDKKINHYQQEISSVHKSIGIVSRLFDCKKNSTSEFRISSRLAMPLASLTKHFLGYVFFYLEQSNQIDLSKPFKNFFPNLKFSSSASVQQLLNHTSGIDEYLCSFNEQDLNEWSLKEYCENISKINPIKNGNFQYSNSNYVLLTAIIEEFSKRPYYEIISEIIFQPLGMKNSFSLEKISEKKTEPAWQKDNQQKWATRPYDRLGCGWGDGSLFVSLDDFTVWLQSGRFENFASHSVRSANDSSTTYHNGLCIVSEITGEFVLHSGSNPGSSSLFIYNVIKQTGAIALINHDCLDEQLIDTLIDSFIDQS